MLFIVLFLLCLHQSLLVVSVEYEFSLVVITLFKNNAPYLAEWLEFHHMLGVQRFVLYNHDSSDHYLDVLAPYLASGTVELRHASSLFPTVCRVSSPPKQHEFVKCQMDAPFMNLLKNQIFFQ